MKKILFFVIFGWSALFGAYNECVTDIYFGNGVWNDIDGANYNRDTLERKIIKFIYNGDHNAFKAHHFTDRGDPNLNKNIVLLAFNWTGSSPNESLSFKSKIIDLIETFYQLKDNNQLEGYSLYDMLKAWLTQDPTDPLSDATWDKIDDIVADYSRAIEGSNLIKMIEDYETISLKKSHRVLLVAHSQGNLFGNEVYDNLPSWEQGYFKMVSIATPASHVLEKKTPYITLKCDKVINENLIGGIPGHLPGNTDCTGEEKSDDRHQLVLNYLANHISLSKIMSAVSESLDILDKAPTQWQTDQEIDKGTCDYRITVKHRFDPALTITEKVYPFAPNQKLYRALDQADGTMAYVKATCGGKSFTKSWENKGENDCLAIDNPPREKITIQARFNPGHNYSSFLPENLQDPVGTIDDSTGCATAHIPEGWITFYRLKSGDNGCVLDYTFA
ncbi:hypothetical protein [Nitratifractor sp.]